MKDTEKRKEYRKNWMKEWRAKNKEKAKESQIEYWKKRLKADLQKEEASSTQEMETVKDTTPTKE